MSLQPCLGLPLFWSVIFSEPKNLSSVLFVTVFVFLSQSPVSVTVKSGKL